MKRHRRHGPPSSRPMPLSEWSHEKHAHRFVTRGELLNILNMHYTAMQRLRWWYRLWMWTRRLVGMHPEQIRKRDLKAQIAQRKAELAQEQKEAT